METPARATTSSTARDALGFNDRLAAPSRSRLRWPARLTYSIRELSVTMSTVAEVLEMIPPSIKASRQCFRAVLIRAYA